MYFHKEIFEKLLFKLNENVYNHIESKIKECIICDKDFIDTSFRIFEDCHNIPAGQLFQPSINVNKLFSATISINYDDNKVNLDEINKLKFPKIGFEACSTGWRDRSFYSDTNNIYSNNLVININKDINSRSNDNRIFHSYKIPLEYVLGFMKDKILSENSYQLYLHTISPPPKNENYSEEYIKKNAYKYIGITKRSWQVRYKEHLYKARKNPHTLFNKAMIGKLCKIGIIEHCVEKAGLSSEEAFDLERREIENRTLNKVFPLGLNMKRGRKMKQ